MQTNHKLHTMPSYQIKFQLEYKVLREGIPVLFVNDDYASKRYYWCGTKSIQVKR
ncbi:MAG: hypothetical protein ACE5R6_08350 [Candidatus Heimdallarchaeota archaeon]